MSDSSNVLKASKDLAAAHRALGAELLAEEYDPYNNAAFVAGQALVASADAIDELVGMIERAQRFMEANQLLLAWQHRPERAEQQRVAAALAAAEYEVDK